MAIVNVFWEEAIKQVREDYINDSREEDFQWWIAKINFIESQGTTIYVSVPSKFVKDQLDARGHTSYIENKLLEISGDKFKIEFKIEVNQEQRKIEIEDDEPVIINQTKEVQNTDISNTNNTENRKKSRLEEDYSFNSFVKHSCGTYFTSI